MTSNKTTLVKTWKTSLKQAEWHKIDAEVPSLWKNHHKKAAVQLQYVHIHTQLVK